MNNELKNENELIETLKEFNAKNVDRDQSSAALFEAALKEFRENEKQKYALTPPLLDDPRRTDFMNFYHERTTLMRFFETNKLHKFNILKTKSGIKLVFVPMSIDTSELVDACKKFSMTIDPFLKVVDELIKEQKKSDRCKVQAAVPPMWILEDGSMSENIAARPAPYSPYFKITQTMVPDYVRTNLDDLITTTIEFIEKKSVVLDNYLRDHQYVKAQALQERIKSSQNSLEILEFVKLHLFVKFGIDTKLKFYLKSDSHVRNVKISALKKNMFKQLSHSGIALVPYDENITQFMYIQEKKSFEDIKLKSLDFSEHLKIKIDVDDEKYAAMLDAFSLAPVKATMAL